MVTVKCSHCGKSKEIFPSRLKYNIHFCNKQCQVEYNKKIPFTDPDAPCSGYVDAQGRMRIFYPTHPRACKTHGYVMRSIVHYEYYNNDIVTSEYNIHHKDKNRLNDTKENLQKLTHAEHSLLHHPKGKKFGEE